MLSKINFLMNKIYLFTAAFAVMVSLSGCSDTELASIDTAQEKTPIGFHTVGSQMGSRATIINSGDITKTDFKVYAFDDAGNAFMGNNDTDDDAYLHNGVLINYDNVNSVWKYANPSDLRYWPDSQLDFYAVSPGTVHEDLAGYCNWKINKDVQTITYTSFDEHGSATTHQNLDVMYAVAKGQTKAKGKVNLTFKHILSQVLFKAKTNDDKLEVQIKEIKFHNFQPGGTFTIPTEEWKLNGYAIIPVTAGMDGTKTVTSTSTEIITKPMLFVPQSLTAWEPTSETKTGADNATPKHSYLEISCRIKQNDTYLFGKDGFKTLYVPFSATWEPGKRYVYTLIFGGGYDENGQPILTPINFDASADEWTNDTGNSTNENDKVTQY